MLAHTDVHKRLLNQWLPQCCMSLSSISSRLKEPSQKPLQNFAATCLQEPLDYGCPCVASAVPCHGCQCVAWPFQKANAPPCQPRRNVARTLAETSAGLCRFLLQEPLANGCQCVASVLLPHGCRCVAWRFKRRPCHDISSTSGFPSDGCQCSVGPFRLLLQRCSQQCRAIPVHIVYMSNCSQMFA